MMKKFFMAALCVFFALNVFAAAPDIKGCEKPVVKTGKQSSRDIARLHGKEIDFVSSYVAEYKCGDDQVIVWASFSENDDAAKALFIQMDEKMPSSQTFSGLKKIKSGKMDVTYVTGMGMDNYYFLHKTGNYWISATGKDTKGFLDKFVKTIK